jgi:hypothetical protein
VLDEHTKSALDSVVARFNFPRPSDYLDARLFANLYVNIPLDRAPKVQSS